MAAEVLTDISLAEDGLDLVIADDVVLFEYLERKIFAILLSAHQENLAIGALTQRVQEVEYLPRIERSRDARVRLSVRR